MEQLEGILKEYYGLIVPVLYPKRVVGPRSLIKYRRMDMAIS